MPVLGVGAQCDHRVDIPSRHLPSQAYSQEKGSSHDDIGCDMQTGRAGAVYEYEAAEGLEEEYVEPAAPDESFHGE